ncbi:MAG TPA: hypothetical protein ENJ84_09685 [Gammaproteobacteria bacterium]|nr:hypothetical protein [Gammaproteobacteria bacterium]
MKKYIIVALLFAAIAMGAGWLFRQSGITHTRHFQNLPWQLTLNERQHLSVFGLTLDESRLQDAVDHWGHFPEIGQFESGNGEQVIEAYFEKVRLGPLDVKAIARIAVSAEKMAEFNQRHINRTPGPSGDFKYELIESDIAQVLELPVTELTYIPKVKIDENFMKLRFGEPAERRELSEQRSLWLYPKKGLAVIIDAHGRDIFQYINPDKFTNLRQRLSTLE